MHCASVKDGRAPLASDHVAAFIGTGFVRTPTGVQATGGGTTLTLAFSKPLLCSSLSPASFSVRLGTRSGVVIGDGNVTRMTRMPASSPAGSIV